MPSHPLRALIVDDEPETLLILVRILTAAGYEVAGTAVNGEEAIEVAQETNPDFILMDMNMPVMNGIKATQRILAERYVPIIMLTSYSMEDHLDAALDAGACCYVTKPVSRAALTAAIADALDPPGDATILA